MLFCPNYVLYPKVQYKKELITYLDIGFSTSLAILSRLLVEREWRMPAVGSFVYFTVSAQKEIYIR